MKYNKAIKVFNKIINKGLLTREELDAFDEYILKLLNLMRMNAISYDEQNLLDTYVNYLRENKKTPNEENITISYDEIVNSRNVKMLAEEAEARRKGEIKVQKLTNHSGYIKVISILEVVIILGLIISIIILALNR